MPRAHRRQLHQSEPRVLTEPFQLGARVQCWIGPPRGRSGTVRSSGQRVTTVRWDTTEHISRVRTANLIPLRCFLVVFSTTSGRTTIHALSCPAARTRAERVRRTVEAPTAREAAQAFAHREQLRSRGYPHPVCCDCCMYSPS